MSSATRIAFWLLLTGLLWLPCWHVVALDPALDVSQYAHTAWRIREGFARGRLTAITQTPDGFLWLGTDLGLVRFDGVRTVPWQPPRGTSLPDAHIRCLLGARDGTLWIGTWTGVASWKGDRLVVYPQFAGHFINSLVEDRDGTIWAAAGRRNAAGKLCAIRKGEARCEGDDGRFGPHVVTVHEDARGRLWVWASTGLWRLRPGVPEVHAISSVEYAPLQSLADDADGGLLIAMHDGITRLDERSGALSSPMLKGVQAGALFRDRNGGVWAANQKGGLLHMHDGRTDAFGKADGLSGEPAWFFFEDREGSIWVATAGGLDQFRDAAAATYSVSQGLSSVVVDSVLASRDGSVWISTPNGLNRFSNGVMWVYRGHHERARQEGLGHQAQQSSVREVVLEGFPDGSGSLFEDQFGRIWRGTNGSIGYLENDQYVELKGAPRDFVDAIAEDAGRNLWFAYRNLGLLRVAENRQVQQISWSQFGGRGSASSLAADRKDGGVWLGFSAGGVAHFMDGTVRESYSAADGLAKGRVAYLEADQDGVLWVGAEGGLSRLKSGRIATLNRSGGLPCDSVDWMIKDGVGAVWVRTACGIARIARSDLDVWAAAADRTGTAKGKIAVTGFDDSQGVRSEDFHGSSSPHAARASDGRLWFATLEGVGVLDPGHLKQNTLPPPVHVEEVVADRQTYEPSSTLRLPPLVHELEIGYTALSFVAPEKVVFRYKLEGRDRDWQDAGNRRRAFDVDLPPGRYRFRVIASNSSGVWNEQGDTLDFSIAPAFWQTIWFRTLCVVAFLGLLWMLYQLRLRQVTRRFEQGLEARVAERTRIARELHDTLLQGFHGVLLRFQTAARLLPTRPAEARQVLETTLDQAEQALADGRNAVQGLRSSVVEAPELADAIKTLGEELATDPARDRFIALSLRMEGTPRKLRTIVRDEIYRIASEALRNAFRHSGATRIEVELHYDEKHFGLRVRDDGKGIDAKFLSEEGRGKHFGLSGMRERAEMIGGKLALWTSPNSGTELELKIPALRAYRASPRRRSWLLERFSTVGGEREP